MRRHPPSPGYEEKRGFRGAERRGRWKDDGALCEPGWEVSEGHRLGPWETPLRGREPLDHEADGARLMGLPTAVSSEDAKPPREGAVLWVTLTLEPRLRCPSVRQQTQAKAGTHGKGGVGELTCLQCRRPAGCLSVSLCLPFPA